MSNPFKKFFLGVLLAGFAIAYGAVSLLIYRDRAQLERITNAPIHTTQAQEAIDENLRHSPAYYRELADKLQFYRHDPDHITKLYKLSLTRGPANYESFFSYAYYLVSRNCCRKEVLAMLAETIRRCPTNPRMHRIAATYLIAVEEKDQALPYFKRAMELHPASARELYRLLDENRLDFQLFVEVTPDQPATLIQLADYLSSRGEPARTAFNDVLGRLVKMTMQLPERLALGKLLLRAGWYTAASQQAKYAASDVELAPDSFRLLAEIAWQQRNWADFERYANQAEESYARNGSGKEAAQYALYVANRLGESNQGKAKEKVLKILNRYPRFGPAYYQMAVYSRADSNRLMFYYLKKAAELSPEYKFELASTYLENGQEHEAEQIYAELATHPEFRNKALPGLARCKLRKGDTAGALLFLRQGLQNAPDSPDIIYAIAQIYTTLSDYEHATASYLRYAELTPKDPEGYNQAADACIKLGQYDRAREYYQLALQRDPQNAHALARLQSLNF